MEISKFVKTLETKAPIKVNSEIIGLPENGCNEEQCEKAFLKICRLWNNTEGSRKFIKHLIFDFALVKDPNVVIKFGKGIIEDNKNRCAILGIKLAELEEINRMINFCKSLEQTYIENNKKKYGEELLTTADKKEINETLKKKFPIEVRTISTAVFSKNSEKFLSTESLFALKKFVYLAQYEPEIKKIFEQIKKTSKKERIPRNNIKKNLANNENISHGFKMSNMMDDNTIEKLKKLK